MPVVVDVAVVVAVIRPPPRGDCGLVIVVVDSKRDDGANRIAPTPKTGCQKVSSIETWWLKQEGFCADS